jgi:hypothetical protein
MARPHGPLRSSAQQAQAAPRPPPSPSAQCASTPHPERVSAGVCVCVCVACTLVQGAVLQRIPGLDQESAALIWTMVERRDQGGCGVAHCSDPSCVDPGCAQLVAA